MPTEPAYVLGMTAAELLQIPDSHAELVRGVLVVREPPGLRARPHSADPRSPLADHVDANHLGRVYVGERLQARLKYPTPSADPMSHSSRQSRLPDSRARWLPRCAPDLVVEILSPGDRPGELLGKVADWLSAGTRLVWVIDPERRLARVYRADGARGKSSPRTGAQAKTSYEASPARSRLFCRSQCAGLCLAAGMRSSPCNHGGDISTRNGRRRAIARTTRARSAGGRVLNRVSSTASAAASPARSALCRSR